MKTAKIITVIALSLFFLIGAVVSCGGKATPAPTATPGAVPTATPQNGQNGVMEKTVSEIVSDILKKPLENPYKSGASIRLSGFIAGKEAPPGSFYLVLGPVKDWYVAVLYPPDGSSEMFDIFFEAKEGDWIVIDTKYKYRDPHDRVIILKGEKVIEFKALQ